MENEPSHKFEIRKISRAAQTIDDYTSYAKKKNLIWAFAEFDITDVRKRIQEYKEATGETLSFTAFIISCFARVVAEHKYPINTMRRKKKEFYIFEEVDVMTNIERDIDGIKKPTNYTIRNADNKTLQEIHAEIRQAQQRKDVKLTAGQGKTNWLVKNFTNFPRFIRKFLISLINDSPEKKKAMLGTVGVTSVGMFGNELGYMIHITPHTMSLGLGSIGPRLRKRNGEIVEREMLGCTIAMDHAIIDGGPATRFFNDLYFMITRDCLDADWCFKSLKKQNL